MNAALVSKICARKNKPSYVLTEALTLARYMSRKMEKDFVLHFAQGLTNQVLDVNYYLDLWRTIKILPKRDRIPMHHIIGLEIDLTNILWVYRLKAFYNIYGATSYGYLIPISYRLKTASLDKAVHCKDIAGLVESLQHTPYRETFGDFSQTNLEAILQANIKKAYHRKGQRSHIAAACGHLHTVQYLEERDTCI